jgi:hypothetical protein
MYTHRLIADYRHRLAVHSTKADNDILCIIRHNLEKVAIVYNLKIAIIRSVF